METKKVYNVHAISLGMMLEKMSEYSNSGPGQLEIMADMRRLTDSVSGLAVLATDTSPETTCEQRDAATIKAASKLGGILPTVSKKLEDLKITTEAGFEQAFIQNSGLIQTGRAAEIRAHLKSLPMNDRPGFIQGLLADNDNESLGALIFAPPYLSGLDGLSHSRLKLQIEETRLPQLTVNREKFEELYENLRVAIYTTGQAVRDCSNSRKLADMADQAVRVAEAQAKLNSATLPGV